MSRRVGTVEEPKGCFDEGPRRAYVTAGHGCKGSTVHALESMSLNLVRDARALVRWMEAALPAGTLDEVARILRKRGVNPDLFYK